MLSNEGNELTSDSTKYDFEHHTDAIVDQGLQRSRYFSERPRRVNSPPSCERCTCTVERVAVCRYSPNEAPDPPTIQRLTSKSMSALSATKQASSADEDGIAAGASYEDDCSTGFFDDEGHGSKEHEKESSFVRGAMAWVLLEMNYRRWHYQCSLLTIAPQVSFTV